MIDLMEKTASTFLISIFFINPLLTLCVLVFVPVSPLRFSPSFVANKLGL